MVFCKAASSFQKQCRIRIQKPRLSHYRVSLGLVLTSRAVFFCTYSTLWCDNLSAAHLACNPVFPSRGKHIELDLHLIRDKVLLNELIVSYIPSIEQVVDILTKNLPSSQFCNLRTRLSVVPYPVSLRGMLTKHILIKTLLVITNPMA